MLTSFVEDAQGSEFPVQNLPWGVFSLNADERKRSRVGNVSRHGARGRAPTPPDTNKRAAARRRRAAPPSLHALLALSSPLELVTHFIFIPPERPFCLLTFLSPRGVPPHIRYIIPSAPNFPPRRPPAKEQKKKNEESTHPSPRDRGGPFTDGGRSHRVVRARRYVAG